MLNVIYTFLFLFMLSIQDLSKNEETEFIQSLIDQLGSKDPLIRAHALKSLKDRWHNEKVVIMLGQSLSTALKENDTAKAKIFEETLNDAKFHFETYYLKDIKDINPAIAYTYLFDWMTNTDELGLTDKQKQEIISRLLDRMSCPQEKIEFIKIFEYVTKYNSELKNHHKAISKLLYDDDISVKANTIDLFANLGLKEYTIQIATFM
ncbi:MAG: hypothetical protein HY606_12335, partial [Planctomycetes bacterium]|nr:hypothetical protein [Planctomycetota bacterium]